MKGEAGHDLGLHNELGFASDEQPPQAVDDRHLDRLAKLGQLTAGIVHELNQPAAFVMVGQATAMRILAELEHALASIDDQRLDNPRQLVRRLSELTSEALGGMDQMRRMIRNVRDFARPTSGAIGTVDVNQIVTSACMITRHELCDCGQVAMDLGALPEIESDALKLTQVLVNLLINAAEAIAARTDGGRRRIRIATRASSDQVTIEVEDDGCGIPESIQDRVFEPFFSTKTGTGSGLGLWLTAEIVKSLQGHIDYESQPGRGTRFRVRLPIEHCRNH